MLKSHKNAFFEVIRRSGLDPIYFEAKEIHTNIIKKRLMKLMYSFSFDESYRNAIIPVFSISVRNSSLRFNVRHLYEDFNQYNYAYTTFRPDNLEMTWDIHKEPLSLESVLNRFKVWLECEAQRHIEDELTMDLWSQFNNYQSYVGDTSSNERDTSDFTQEEKRDVRHSVEEFRRLLTENFHLTQEQAEYVNSQLDYLSEAVDRLNRFDWRGLAISVVIGIAINLSVDTERGRLLFKLFEQVFHASIKLLK